MPRQAVYPRHHGEHDRASGHVCALQYIGHDGFVTVTGVGSRGGMADRVSCRCDSVGPLRSCLGSEDPQGRSGDQVALKVESVVDRGVHVQETLGGFGRFKALQLALSSSYHLMKNSLSDCSVSAPVRDGTSAVIGGTPSHTSAACR